MEQSNINTLLAKICASGTEEYHCYDTLKQILKNNNDMMNIIAKGIENNQIYGFSEELWEELSHQNLRSPGVVSFVDVFRDGYNQGYCTVCAKQVSYSLDTCYLCGGILPILKGTINCPEGAHTWIEYDNKIIDTTLMLVIDNSYKDALGYIEENRYNPNNDPIYSATKEFTNDVSIRKR